MHKRERTPLRKIIKIFTATLSLSAFTFGGGYVIVPLMRRRFVEELQWIEEKEMLNLIAIAQSSPGAVAVNTSILLGFHVAGKTGALAAILGTILPPLLVMSVLAAFYDLFRDNAIVRAVMRGMQAGVAAVIIDVVFKLGSNVVRSQEAVSIIIMLAAFAAVFFFQVNVLFVLLAAALIGAVKLILYTYKQKAGEIK